MIEGRADRRPGSCVPHLGGTIVTRRHQPAAIGTERSSADVTTVTNHGDLFASGYVANPGRAVAAGDGQTTAIRAELAVLAASIRLKFWVMAGVKVSQWRGDSLPCSCVPDVHSGFTSRHDAAVIGAERYHRQAGLMPQRTAELL